jgi:aspartyl-tRNA(Asn)/glutamyl-tRNA(Gln) amidotransferase subunit A
MPPVDLPGWSIDEASNRLRAGEITCEDVLDACLAQVDRLDPVLNAFISRRDDAARVCAGVATRALAAGAPPSRLTGLPLAHKDMFARTGETSTFGAHPGRCRRASTTSTVKARLDATLAPDLGGLNMSEYAAGPTGVNAHYGRCANPWNPARMSGGSSSGSAVAVAATMIFGSVGSDTGGSIRIPAALCGVTGLKPTYGRVSRHGAMPRVWSQDSIGPIARSAADCAAILAAIAGPDDFDPLVVAQAGRFAWSPHRRTWRIGVVELADGADRDVEACVDAAIRDLVGMGCTVTAARWDRVPETLALAELVHKVEASALHDCLLRHRKDEYGDFVRERFEEGLAISGVRYVQALSLRAPMVREFVQAVLRDCDAVVLPTVGCVAPFADAGEDDTAAQRAILRKLTRYTRPFSYLGLPAISLPCGFGDAGMPVGLQIVGPPFAEGTLLSIADAYQRATGWHRQRPPIASA